MSRTPDPVYSSIVQAEIAAERGDLYLEQLWRRRAEALALAELTLVKAA